MPPLPSPSKSAILRNAAGERRQITPGTKDANAKYCRCLLGSEVLAISVGVPGITNNARTSDLNEQLIEMGHHEFPFIDVVESSEWWAKCRSLSGLKELEELFCFTPPFFLRSGSAYNVLNAQGHSGRKGRAVFYQGGDQTEFLTKG